MTSKKLRIHNTDINNLVSNLRGEVGEIIFTWVLMRNLMAKSSRRHTDDPVEKIANDELRTLYVLIDKLMDEIVARLSELAEEKIGRLTFHFAQLKLGQFQKDVSAFARFIKSNKFHEKRNQHISHKELPEKWSDHKHIHIPYPVVLRGIAYALRLMKKIDRHILGPSAPYLWREMRKRRYLPTNPVRTGYMLLPHLYLTTDQRAEIIRKEMDEGQSVWVNTETKVNGVQVTVKACEKWGALLLGPQMIVLPQYPLQELHNISIGASGSEK